MNKEQKTHEVEGLRQVLQGAPSAFVLTFSGLTVNQAVSLRKKVRGAASHYKVVKNRLALRGLRGTPLEPLASHFKGPTAIAYSSTDPAGLAKVLHGFASGNEGLKLKAGFIDGRVIGPQEIKTLAELPPRDVLLSRLLGALQGPMASLVRVLKGPITNFVRVLDQIAKKTGSSGGDAAPAGEAPPPV